MAEIKIQHVQKNTDTILQKIGKDSFVNWDSFSQSSTEVARSIDQLNGALAIFREVQHKSFIQTMRKLKGLDIPDVLQAVKSKKLPKQALRGVLSRFKMEGDNLQLAETKEQLQENAKKQFDLYTAKNKQFTQALKSYTQFINKKIQQSGLAPSKQIPQEKTQINPTVKFHLDQQQANKIASQIKIQYLTGTKFISFETYSQIIDGTYKLIRTEFQRLTQQARKNQRENLKNHKQYLKIMNQYLMNGEALINQGQTLVASKVGVTQDKLSQSQMALMDRGLGNNLFMVQSQLRAKIKQSLQSDKDVSVSTAKQIIKYQVQLIDQRSSQINSILSGLDKGPEVIQMVPMLLALILNDCVFQKYGYEQEDFMKNLGEDVITTNPQFANIFKDMEMGIMRLMQKLDVIPPEVAQMMKQQQALMQQMSAQGMPPGMMPGLGGPGMGAPNTMPGMGQSSNPMDMLQMQQLQQMQAMFSQMGMQPPK